MSAQQVARIVTNLHGENTLHNLNLLPKPSWVISVESLLQQRLFDSLPFVHQHQR